MELATAVVAIAIAHAQLCEEDFFVNNSACVACGAGLSNGAGDDPTGAATNCSDTTNDDDED